MLRYFFLTFTVVGICILGLAGFRGQKMTQPPIEIFPDMDHQPKIQPQHPSEFFADHRGARQPVAGTLPMGYTLPHAYYQLGARNVGEGTFTNFPDYVQTGVMGQVYGDGIPVPVTAELLTRGQERFNINCAICHGAVAMGDGIIKTYGLVTIASLQDERVRTQPDGQIFTTITNGKNTMGAYGPQISVEDRWAIIAYLRALQKSQNVRLADLPAERQQALNAPKQ